MIDTNTYTGQGTVVDDDVDDPPPATSGARRELRIALAMRGGVSLAVWIGGAVAEIDRLRRSSLKENEIYHKLLDLNGYRDVIVDVVSGASAGGLNGVVYSASQLHGFDMGALRNLWLELGDIELLARDTTAGGRAASAVQAAQQPLTRSAALRPPSLLRGDEYFYTNVRDALGGLAAAGNSKAGPDRLHLLLSATLLEPIPMSTLVDRNTVIEDVRSNALFRFMRNTTGGVAPTSNIGQSPDEMNLLAMAARATSSFPGAFEPAGIGVGSEDDSLVDGLDFSSIFEVPGAASDGSVYKVIDGGVLDNIPVGAAIEAVVDAPADGPTDRWVCYLHPSPAANPAPAEEVDRTAPRLVRTAFRTLSTRFNQETLLEDTDELASVNDAIARRGKLRQSLLAPYASAGVAGVLADAAVPERIEVLREILAQFEAHRIRTNLESLSGLGVDGALRLGEWPPGLQVELSTQLLHACRTRVEAGDPSESITIVSDAIDLLIAHARTIENLGDALEIQEAGRIKSELYSLRFEVEAIVRTETSEWAAALAALGNPANVDPGSVATRVLEADGNIAAASAPGVAGVWHAVVDAASQLSALAVGLPLPFSLVQRAQPGQHASVIGALVFLMQPVGLLGRGPWNPLTFVYVNGDAPTTLPFHALVEDGRITAKQKLAGNELANFAAFLSATWRANDWMWGRMDAAATLIGQLCGPGVLGDDSRRAALVALAQIDPSADDQAIVAALRDRVQQQIFDAEAPTIRSTPTSAVDATRSGGAQSVETYDIGRQTLTDLGEARRTRVGMRMAHLAYAALRPGGGSERDRLVRAVTSLLKPLYLVAVFTFLSPARSFLALAIGASAVQTTFGRSEPEFALRWDLYTKTLLIATVLVAASSCLIRFWNAGRAGSVPKMVVGGLAFASLLALFRGAGSAYLILATVNIAITVVAIVRIFRRFTAGDRSSRVLLTWFAAAVVAAAGTAVGWLHPLWNGDERDWATVRDLLWVVVPAAALTTLIGSSWMRRCAVLVAVALTVVLGLGTLSITRFRDHSILDVPIDVWLWIAGAMLIVMYLIDVAKLWKYASFAEPQSRWPLVRSAIGWLAFLCVTAGVVTTQELSVSMGAWAIIAVVAVSYANVALATHLPVFKPPQRLTSGNGRSAPAGRRTRPIR